MNKLRQGNWAHPDGDGARIVGWVIEAEDVGRMKADAFCLPREVGEALELLRARSVPPEAVLRKPGALDVGLMTPNDWLIRRNEWTTRVVDERFAQGWNECRKAMMEKQHG